MAENSLIRKAVERVRKLIDEVTDPKEMTPKQYDEFLDELASDIDGRIECRREEQKND